MRVIFLGTPEFAVPSLEKLCGWSAVSVVAVVAQPDRPAGRGQRVFPPPTKLVAARYEIPVLQPERLSKAPDLVQQMRDLHPDVLVSVAFGQILKKDVLEMAPMGVVNVHGSLLPKYRGAAPINWAILNGESTTGVTTMFSDPGIDTGPMLLSRQVPIGPDETAEELAEKMSFVAADVLLETLDGLAAGSITPVKQNDAEATMAPRLTKEMALIDWSRPAAAIHNHVRGLIPWPGSETRLDDNLVKINKTIRSETSGFKSEVPGTITMVSDPFMVACGPDGTERLIIAEVKPANKGAMSPRDWANGARIKSGARFSPGTGR